MLAKAFKGLTTKQSVFANFFRIWN